jgi:hypothetical protein
MANPLTLIIPLKEGVDLGQLGKSLAELQPQIDAALEAVGTVHYARFVVFDRSSPDLQPKGGAGPFSLSVITSFDGDFDVYIQDFVTKVGPVFNALLSFSADGTGLVPVAEHLQGFTDYVAAHNASQQPPNNAFGLYSAYPYTVQQVLAAGGS